VLTLEDCFQLGELTEDEISAIAEHERIPAVAAVGLGNHLLGCPDGRQRLMAMIENGFVAAKTKRDCAEIMHWQGTVNEFREKHLAAPNALSLEWQRYTWYGRMLLTYSTKEAHIRGSSPIPSSLPEWS